jgi:2,5-diketo-D-gluconate reductase A
VINVPMMKLQHGGMVPQLGLGTWPMNDRESARTVAEAIKMGYRLIDTAENYGNEHGVGQAIEAAGVPREELFITTKFNKKWHGVELVSEAFAHSADRLGVDYIDLLLIHWPNPAQDRYVQAWRGLIGLLEEGKLRAIGTSNFKPSHLDRIIETTGVTPDVNQIELNPCVARRETREYHVRQGIVTQSWSPLGGQGTRLLDLPVITGMAARYGKTPAQVVLRWHVQHGLVVIPKSAHPQRLRENLEVFGFSLADEDMAALDALDRGEGAAVDSDSFGH